jgi:hypothetical protein
MSKRTYWIRFPRGFANEYDIGIANSQKHAAQYRAEGYKRIPRARALRELTWQGDAATKAYVGCFIDSSDKPWDRFATAQLIRAGYSTLRLTELAFKPRAA